MSSALVFNTPVESALRSVVLLFECYPNGIDMQRLVYFDYLLVHSEDAGGPESLHPRTPHRAGELIVRRELIQRGLYLLLARGLIERSWSDKGIDYKASELAGSFIVSLQASYSLSLRDRAKWVTEEFSTQSIISLEEFFTQNFDRWGEEFVFSYPAPDGDE